MIHGPCSQINTRAPCMGDNFKCTKRYPKSFVSETITSESGYPIYRRRSPNEGGFQTEITKNSTTFTIDNRWIVPYCPLLCKIFKAHINVEYCCSVKAIIINRKINKTSITY